MDDYEHEYWDHHQPRAEVPVSVSPDPESEITQSDQEFVAHAGAYNPSDVATDHGEPHPLVGMGVQEVEELLTNARWRSGASLNEVRLKNRKIRELKATIRALNEEKLDLVVDRNESIRDLENEIGVINEETEEALRSLRVNLAGAQAARDELYETIRQLDSDKVGLQQEIIRINQRLKTEETKRMPVEADDITELKKSEAYHRERLAQVNANNSEMRREIDDLKKQLKAANARGDVLLHRQNRLTINFKRKVGRLATDLAKGAFDDEDGDAADEEDNAADDGEDATAQ